MNLTLVQQQIADFLTRGIVLETDDYRKYKKYGGALIPSLIDNHIMRVPLREIPYVLLMHNDVAARVYDADLAGAAERRPLPSADDSACSLVGLRIDWQFSMDSIATTSNVLWLDILEACVIEMMNVMRMKFDHLCIQNLLGEMPETIHNVNVVDKFSEFNFGAIKEVYKVANGGKSLSLKRYIPVNATFPSYPEGHRADTLAAEKLTVGKIALASDALGRVSGQKILLVPQSYMPDLALDKHVMSLQSTISAALGLSPDIVSYTSLFGVYVIGIPDMHFPPNIGNGVAHWVNEENGGGNVKMLTTDAAIEKEAKVDYGIMYIAEGESFKIAEVINPTTPSLDVVGNENMTSGAQLYGGPGRPSAIFPLYEWLDSSNKWGDFPSMLKTRLDLIYWFSRPRLENVVAIELNPGFNKINEIA